jgi:hypothetical protein
MPEDQEEFTMELQGRLTRTSLWGLASPSFLLFGTTTSYQVTWLFQTMFYFFYNNIYVQTTSEALCPRINVSKGIQHKFIKQLL